MACPHVAGVVALMLDANPSLTPENVKQLLHASAEPRGSPSFPGLDPKYNTHYGWGIVDAYSAVNLALGFREVIISIDYPDRDYALNHSLKGIETLSGTASVDRGTVTQVEVTIDDPDFKSNVMVAEGTSSWSVSWDTKEWKNGNHFIFARAISGNYTAMASIEVNVNNQDTSGGDEILGEDGDDLIKIGSLKISLLAAATFVAILTTVIILIVAAVIIHRRRKIMKILKERQVEQEYKIEPY
jgi:hypothetical protein